MHRFDPRDWWPLDGQGGDRGRDQGPDDLDRILVAGLVAAACLCLGSFHPPEVAPAAIASLLILAAFGSAAEAVWRGEHLYAEGRLTAWDQAAALLALGLLLRLIANTAIPSMGGPVP